VGLREAGEGCQPVLMVFLPLMLCSRSYYMATKSRPGADSPQSAEKDFPSRDDAQRLDD
jgi:hypothetical protein